MHKRASAAKKSHLFRGHAFKWHLYGSNPRRVRKKVLSLGLTGRRFKFNVLNVVLEMGRHSPLISPFLNDSHYARKKKKKKQSRKKNQSKEVEKAVDSNELCGSCSGSFKDVIRGVYWMQYTNCDHWYHETCEDLRQYECNIKCIGCKYENRLTFMGGGIFSVIEIVGLSRN